MRNPDRIPICLKLLFPNQTLSKFLGDYPQDKYLKCGYVKRIHENWDLIEKTWLEYPDLRFGQLLCTLRLIPSLEIENHIWNVEEDNWLIDNKYCNIEDIKFWGINFYKNNKRRKKTKFVLLKNLKIDHIKNIINFFEVYNSLSKLNPKYLEYFNKRIEQDE